MLSNVKEVEKRYQIRCDRKSIIKKILDAGFTLAHEENETDIYFTSPIRDFILSRECLRVRESNNISTLTWKPPSTEAMIEKNMHWKEELDISLHGQTDKTLRLLEILGFTVCATVHKSRSSYTNSGDVQIFLDEVKGLGLFLEIEIICSDVQGGIAKISCIENQLGLDKEWICETPYRDMVIQNE